MNPILMFFIIYLFFVGISMWSYKDIGSKYYYEEEEPKPTDAK